MQRVGDETLAGLAPADRQKLAPSVSVEQLFSATKPPVRRRPRRTELVNLVVRIELAGTTPPVWRRLELASDLFLDEVHEIVQAAFGWTDSHLHRFGCGPTYYSRETEYYLCPFSVDEGDEGVPEERVRLDEVLVDVGDTLF
jgi:Plasmid pRiA4b ORF-3-like protein